MSEDPRRADALDEQRQAREHEEEATRRVSDETGDAGAGDDASTSYEEGMPTSTDER